MTVIPLIYPPGVCKVQSSYASQGRVIDMNLARFVAGRPEQMGKASSINGSNSGVGYVRAIKDFRDLLGNSYYSIAASSGLLSIAMSPFYALTIDATPLRNINSGSLTNPITTNATTIVSIAHTAHGLSSGDWVTLTAQNIVDGVLLANVYPVTSITDVNNYVITVPVAAGGSTSSAGGTVAYNYPRKTLTNPFDTIINTPTVTVHHMAHGAVTGDYVYISGASAIGGVTPSGKYLITKTGANTYTINYGSNATSTVNSGGGTPSVRYNVSMVTGAPLAGTWSLANYGSQLLSNPSGASIYVYDPAFGGHSYQMYNAPAVVYGMFVTPERFIFALGASTNYLKVQWPDQSDNTQWTATAANTANSRTLQIGSYLVNGIAMRDGISLVLSNNACNTFNYTGDNNVYASSAASTNTGLISGTAICTSQNMAFWMEHADFFMWNGQVERIPSDDIRDYVFRDLDKNNAYKCFASANTPKKEIWFGYPSLADNTGECTRYVIYHIDQNCWSIGKVPIGGMLDSGLLNYPIIAWNNTDSGNEFATFYLDYTPNQLNLPNAFSSNFTIGNINPISYVTYGPLDISSGNNIMDIFSFFPDLERFTQATSNGLNITINTQNYPADNEGSNSSKVVSNGPYGFTSLNYISNNRIDIRIGARMIGYIIASNDSSLVMDWRLGVCKAEVQQAGARR